MNSKVLPLISDEDKIINLAERLFLEGDEIGGISLLKSLLMRTPFNYCANLLLANFYFKTHNHTPCKRYGYMALGSTKESFDEAEVFKLFRSSGFVYGKDLSPMKLSVAVVYCIEEGEHIIEESQAEIMRMLDDDAPRSFKVVFDRTSESDGEFYKEGRSAFVNGCFEDAVMHLSKISRDSRLFLKAGEMIALSKLALQEYDLALSAADLLNTIDKDNFVAGVVTCASFLGQGNRDDYAEAFKRLKYAPVDMELYRDVITLAVARESYGELLFVADRYLRERPLDANVLYIRAVAKYNLGDIEGCEDDLKLSLSVFEDILVRRLLDDIVNGKYPKKLWVTRFIDRKVVEKEVYELVRRVTDEQLSFSVEIEDVFRVCDLISRSNAADLFPHGMRMGMVIDPPATKEYLKRVAMDACVSDEVKMYLISELLFTDVNMTFKCLHAGAVKHIDLRPVNFDFYAKELFEEVYKHVALNVFAFDASAIPTLRRGIRRLQRSYKANGGREDANFAPIAAAVLFALNVNGISGEDAVCSLFAVSKEELYEAVDLLMKKEKNL